MIRATCATRLFINVANLTLTHRDSYIALRQSWHQARYFDCSQDGTPPHECLVSRPSISKAEKEIRHHEDKHIPSSSHKGSQHFHHYCQASRQHSDPDRKSIPPAWKQLKRRGQRSNRGKASTYNNRPRGKRILNDNYYVYCVAGRDQYVCVTGIMGILEKNLTRKDCLVVTRSTETRTFSNVNCGVVKLVPFAGGLPQNKGLNPDYHMTIKAVKGVSCVDQFSSVNLVTKVPTVVPDLPVGTRLQP